MFRGAIRPFLDDESGAIGPTYAVAILVMVAIAGIGFDYGRLASLDTELQNAADHAALAGATQLDGEAGACANAVNAVRTYITNNTRMATDNLAPAVTFQNETDCDATGLIRFWQDKNKQTAATSDDEARIHRSGGGCPRGGICADAAGRSGQLRISARRGDGGDSVPPSAAPRQS